MTTVDERIDEGFKRILEGLAELKTLNLQEKGNRGSTSHPDYIDKLSKELEETHSRAILAEANERLRKQVSDADEHIRRLQSKIADLGKQIGTLESERNDARRTIADYSLRFSKMMPSDKISSVTFDRYALLLKHITPILETCLVQWACSRSPNMPVPGYLGDKMTNPVEDFRYCMICLTEYISVGLGDDGGTDCSEDKAHALNRLIASALLLNFKMIKLPPKV